MTNTVGGPVAARKKADQMRLQGRLFMVLGVVWILTGIMPVVLDWLAKQPIEGPNTVFLALGPVFIALGAVQLGNAKKALAEAGEEPRR